MCKVQYRYASPAQGRSASMHDIVIDSREDACEKAALNYWKLAMRKGNFSIDVSWQPNDKRPLSIEYETQTCKGEDYQESVLSDTRGQEELLRLWQ